MDSSAACHIGEDGTVTLISGSPDIGGSRASLALMAAEELGIDYHKIRPIVADTASIGFNFLTGGSRVTFATGMAVVQAVRDAIDEMRARAAKLWEVDVEAVIWEDGCAKPAGSNVGDFDPMTLAEIAASAGKTGGPINGHAQLNAQGAGPGFGAQIYVSVDADTGHTTVERGTVVQTSAPPFTPIMSRVNCWASSKASAGLERGIYLQRQAAGKHRFLDYRMPVASTCR